MKLPMTALAFVLALGFATSQAEAQVMTPYGSFVEVNGTPTFAPYYMPSYSYWTAAYYGFPPRIYAGYGYNDFPYYGQPYGSPSDPWSWPAMAGYPYGIPTRFNLELP